MDFFKALIPTVTQDFFLKSQKVKIANFELSIKAHLRHLTQVFITTVKYNLCNIFTK